MTTAEHAGTIRQSLKTRGWTSRQVSVRTDVYSMGSAIRITIKDPAIQIGDVRAIAEPHERIHRCAITGDILSGGNRYVDVNYSRDAMDIRRLRYLPAITQAAAEREQHGDSSLIPIQGTPYMLGESPYDRYTLWSDTFLCEAYTLEGLASELANRIREDI